MAADLRDALAGLAVGSGDVLSEAYLSTDDRVTRRVADDGSCRPVWLAMKLAAAAGQIEVFGSALDGYRRSSE